MNTKGRREGGQKFFFPEENPSEIKLFIATILISFFLFQSGRGRIKINKWRKKPFLQRSILFFFVFFFSNKKQLFLCTEIGQKKATIPNLLKHLKRVQTIYDNYLQLITALLTVLSSVLTSFQNSLNLISKVLTSVIQTTQLFTENNSSNSY